MIIDDVLKDFGSTSAFHHQRVNINQLHAFKKAWQTPDSSYNSCHGSWTYFGMLPLYVEETQVTIVVKIRNDQSPRTAFDSFWVAPLLQRGTLFRSQRQWFLSLGSSTGLVQDTQLQHLSKTLHTSHVRFF